MFKISNRNFKITIFIFIMLFLGITLPVALKRPTGGRSGERQGQTAGMIRIFCQNPDMSYLSGPQVMYGNNPFNLEFPFPEWVQAKIARTIDGPKCDSVEPVAKIISVIFSAIAIIAIGLLSKFLYGNAAGLISSLMLASNELWIRYSTYSMIDNRMLMCALFAIYFTFKRRPVLTYVFWSLTIMQKPQTFTFVSTFWIALEFVQMLLKKQKPSSFFSDSKKRNTLVAFTIAVMTGYIYYVYSSRMNAESDLPWVLWMGPRTHQWFFGDWSERLRFVFYKSVVLDWFKKSSLNVAFIISLILIATSVTFRLVSKRQKLFKKLLLLSLPFLIGRFFYAFVFHNVFNVHEYYSLAVNVTAALVSGGVLGALYNLHTGRSASKLITLSIIATLAYLSVTEVSRYFEFTRNIDNKTDWRYLNDWNQQVFPKADSFVVMANPVGGRDILYLYLTKQRGFAWCVRNEEFAPRAFWKKEGVQFVAWWTGYNPNTRHNQWIVRTIDEELKIAREKGWSSDTQDVWSAHSMKEWSELAGRLGRDPCGNDEDFDPRKWN